MMRLSLIVRPAFSVAVSENVSALLGQILFWTNTFLDKCFFGQIPFWTNTFLDKWKSFLKKENKALVATEAPIAYFRQKFKQNFFPIMSFYMFLGLLNPNLAPVFRFELLNQDMSTFLKTDAEYKSNIRFSDMACLPRYCLCQICQLWPRKC